MSKIIEFNADVYLDDYNIDKGLIIEDLLEAIGCYLEYVGVNNYSVDTSMNDLVIKANKHEVYKSIALGNECLTKVFSDYDTIVPALLPSGHTEISVSVSIDWEKCIV